MKNGFVIALFGVLPVRAKHALFAWGKTERFLVTFIALSAFLGLGAAFTHLVEFRSSSKPKTRASVITSSPAPADIPINWEASSPFSREPLGPIAGFRRIVMFQPPYDPVDATRFKSGDLIVQLADLEGPSASAVCFDSDQNRWGCGRQGRAALYNLIRQETLRCRGIAQSAQSSDPVVLQASCESAQGDIAVELLRTGFVRTSRFSSPVRREAQSEAQTAQRGLWNGNWGVVP